MKLLYIKSQPCVCVCVCVCVFTHGCEQVMEEDVSATFARWTWPKM